MSHYNCYTGINSLLIFLKPNLLLLVPKNIVYLQTVSLTFTYTAVQIIFVRVQIRLLKAQMSNI